MKYLYFSAQWCGPCKMLGPKMKLVGEQVTVEKINVDENQELTQKYGVRNIPAVILVDADGNELERIVGVNSPEVYLEKFKEYEG
jgi:thioredoxin 1